MGRMTPEQERLHKQATQFAEKARHFTTERDRVVRELRATGLSLREIGEAIGLSHAGVQRILKRGD